jgi:ketosteroid isomerase-like protein
MSQESIETLRRSYEAFNADDLEPLRALLDPEFVYRTREEFPERGSYGLEAALNRLSVLLELFDEVRCEPQEFIDAGERTVVVARQIARGHASGVMIDELIVHVWRIQNGRAKELRVYAQRAQALEAIRLLE